jgi:hypothetical protein
LDGLLRLRSCQLRCIGGLLAVAVHCPAPVFIPNSFFSDCESSRLLDEKQQKPMIKTHRSALSLPSGKCSSSSFEFVHLWGRAPADFMKGLYLVLHVREDALVLVRNYPVLMNFYQLAVTLGRFIFDLILGELHQTLLTDSFLAMSSVLFWFCQMVYAFVPCAQRDYYQATRKTCDSTGQEWEHAVSFRICGNVHFPLRGCKLMHLDDCVRSSWLF